MPKSPRNRWLVLAVAATLVACNKTEDAAKIPLSANAKMPQDSVHAGMVAPKASAAALPPAAQAALDSGNVLERKKMYPQALEQYRAAGRIMPEHAAPAFGIYMVAREMKNNPLADSALAAIKKNNEIGPHGNTDSGAAADAHRKAGMKVPTKA